MSKQVKPKPTFEVGQTLYVSVTGWLHRDSEPKLYEYEVTRFNGSSVYAKNKQFPGHHERRFTIRTMSSEDSFGEHYQVYLNPDEYWNKIERAKRKLDLRTEVSKKIETLTAKELEAVQEFIKKLQKENSLC